MPITQLALSVTFYDTQEQGVGLFFPGPTQGFTGKYQTLLSYLVNILKKKVCSIQCQLETYYMPFITTPLDCMKLVIKILNIHNKQRKKTLHNAYTACALPNQKAQQYNQ